MPTRRRSETGEKPLNGVIRGGIVETPNVMAFPAGTPRGGEVPKEAEYVHVFSPPNPDFGRDERKTGGLRTAGAGAAPPDRGRLLIA